MFSVYNVPMEGGNFKGRKFLFRMQEGHISKLVHPLVLGEQSFRMLECLEEMRVVPGVGNYYKVKSTPEDGGEAQEFYIRIFGGQIRRVEYSSIPIRREKI